MTSKVFTLLVMWWCLTGAGPILVDTNGTGQGIGWGGGTVRYRPETGSEGGLGKLSNEEALEMIRFLFQRWREVTLHDIPVADFDVIEEEGLGSVDAANLEDHFTYCPPDKSCSGEEIPFVMGSARTGASPIIFDDDGRITDLIQGEGAKKSILGFAGPRVLETVDGVLAITEGQAVLNGLFIDCPEGAASGDSCQSPEVTLQDFAGVVFHELGHFIGLDHSQVNLSSALKALSGDASEIDGVPTMFPLLVDGEAQKTPHYDDAVSVALLYPSEELADNFCTLQGTVYRQNGVTELQGVNVVAQRADDPLLEATSFVSGQFYTGSFANCEAPAGGFTIQGIFPGAGYTVSIEKISRAFGGGSSIEPCDPPQTDFQEMTLEGTFACARAGEVITIGTGSTTEIVTTKGSSTTGDDTGNAADPSSSRGGCSLIR